MIVQPAPTAARSPLRRALRIAALVAPVFLLLAVVAVGIAAPADPGATTARATPGTLALARPETSSAPVVSETTAEGVPAAPGPPAFPTIAADLGVQSVAEARTWLDEISPGPFAVAGWLTDLYPYGACPAAGGDTRGVLGPLCPRRARLDAEAAGAGADVHIHLAVPAGTRLPPVLERVDRPPGPVPVVIVGRIGEKEIPCEATDDDCRSDLVVERVTWANGAPFDPGPVYDAYLELAPSSFMFRHLDSARTLAIGSFGTVLQEALIRPTTVARVDPEAAAAMADGPAPHDLVWYVRGLEPFDTGLDAVHDAAPRYSWVVLDYETGETIARGPRGVSP